MITVTVVTNPELGWDCVMDVIRGDEEAAIKHIAEELGDTVEGVENSGLVFSEHTV